jgi:hypothetical protein
MHATTIDQPGALERWRETLEREPQWTERLREEMRARECAASELVIVIGEPECFPRTALMGARVAGYFVIVGHVRELMENSMPVRLARTLADDDRRAHPRHAHAAIMHGPIGETIRFRVPLVG